MANIFNRAFAITVLCAAASGMRGKEDVESASGMEGLLDATSTRRTWNGIRDSTPQSRSMEKVTVEQHVAFDARVSDANALEVTTACVLFVMVAWLLKEWRDGGIQKASTGSSPSHLSTMQRRCLQAIALWQIVIDLSESSFVVPFAYDFAGSLYGSGSNLAVAFLSGLIQASSPAGMILGLIVAYCLCRRKRHSLNRFLMVLAPLLSAGVYVSLSCLLHFHESYRHLKFVVIAARFAAGFFSGFDLLLTTLARDITEESEQVAFSLLEYMALSAGLALGPLVTSVVSSPMSVDGLGCYSQEVQAACAISILYAVLAFCISYCVPRSEPLSSASDGEDGEENSEGDGARQASALLVGCACVFLGIFSCAAVEVSSSLLLELQYSWGVAAIGRAMAGVYAVVIFLCVSFLALQNYCSTSCLLKAASFGILGGAALLFDAGSDGALQLLLSDLVMYPCITALVAIVDGYVYMGRHDFISTEGLNLAMYVIDSIARALAAPSVRSIIVSKGRNAYAFFQLGTAVLLVALALGMSLARGGESQRRGDSSNAGLIK